MPIIFISNGFPDVLSLNHVFFLKCDYEVRAICGLHFDGVDGSDFDGGFWEFFEGVEDIGDVAFVVFGDIREVVEEPIFDNKESFVTKNTRFIALFNDLGYLKGIRI